jgi:hypothetical protein
LPSETLSELQALVRDRERFVVEHRRVQHQLRAVFSTYYPGLTGDVTRPRRGRSPSRGLRGGRPRPRRSRRTWRTSC